LLRPGPGPKQEIFAGKSVYGFFGWIRFSALTLTGPGLFAKRRTEKVPESKGAR
jgi:hypothetical protein